jgi:2-epi-5-epi-valiolone synthase
VDTEAGSVISSMPMRCLSQSDYTVELVHGVLDPSISPLPPTIGGRHTLIVTTPSVYSLYGLGLETLAKSRDADITIHVMPSGEVNKTIDTVLSVCRAASEAKLARRDLFVAFGGGVCSDVVTLAASMVRKGLPYVCVPTTVIAQVDAGIGVKGAVNLGAKKNYLGCYRPPERVLVDQSLLRTLPEDEVRWGISEIAKICLLRDAELFELLVDNGPALIATGFDHPFDVGEKIISRSIELMLDELEPNCYEDQSLRRLVDLGHTFSPAIEELSGYSISHGAAVAIDIALTCAIGVQLGLLDQSSCMQILEAFDVLRLPTSSHLCTVESMTRAMESTCAHRAGALNLVVPTTIGCATFVEEFNAIAPSTLETALEFLALRTVRGAQKLSV